MNKERIARLADFLDELDPKRFNMGAWARKKTGYLNDSYGYAINPLELNPHACGTRGCIAGWTIWLFKDEPDAPQILRTAFAYDAGRRLLGLTDDVTGVLFYDMAIETPKDAAARLRALL